jgi:hypothetical protein
MRRSRIALDPEVFRGYRAALRVELHVILPLFLDAPLPARLFALACASDR